MSDLEQEVWAEDLMALVKDEQKQAQTDMGAITKTFKEALPDRAQRDPADLLRMHTPHFPL